MYRALGINCLYFTEHNSYHLLLIDYAYCHVGIFIKTLCSFFEH